MSLIVHAKPAKKQSTSVTEKKIFHTLVLFSVRLVRDLQYYIIKDGELANYPTQNKCLVPPLYKRGRCGRDKLKVVQDEAARPSERTNRTRTGSSSIEPGSSMRFDGSIELESSIHRT